MSKLETPLHYEAIGKRSADILIEELPAVSSGTNQGRRLLDGNVTTWILHTCLRTIGLLEIEHRDTVVIQAKAKRLGMYLTGSGDILATTDKAVSASNHRYGCNVHQSVMLC